MAVDDSKGCHSCRIRLPGMEMKRSCSSSAIDRTVALAEQFEVLSHEVQFIVSRARIDARVYVNRITRRGPVDTILNGAEGIRR